MAASTILTQTSLPFDAAPTSLKVVRNFEDRSSVVDNLLQIIEKEYRKGNLTVTKDKYQALLKLKEQQLKNTAEKTPPLPAPLYPPIFHKFTVAKPSTTRTPSKKSKKRRGPITFKNTETVVISILETLANILDNLHLFSKLPMFPERLLKVLKHTNRLWVLILVFLIRKTVSQLLNLVRKENKVKSELSILRGNSNSKLLEDEKSGNEDNVFRKYEKVLRDLKFDKMMLIIELVGNFLDLAFNVIELYSFPVPEWFMNTLNFASMGMTIYRMNKDDEYADADITDDMI